MMLVQHGGCCTSTLSTAAVVVPRATLALGGLLAMQGLGVGLAFLTTSYGNRISSCIPEVSSGYLPRAGG